MFEDRPNDYEKAVKGTCNHAPPNIFNIDKFEGILKEYKKECSKDELEKNMKHYPGWKPENQGFGYHKRDIKKRVIGTIEKIQEELEEALDAKEQDCELMVLIELSDMIGAIDLYLKNNHPTLDLNDLIKMSRITQRAFENGRRG